MMASQTKDNYGVYATLNQDELQLEESLVAPAAEEMAKPSIATPMMEVIAPATLSEGYQFETIVDDGSGNTNVMKVTVPTGGVEKGQKFYVSATAGTATSSNVTTTTVVNPPMPNGRISVPVGHWRDGICDCFKYGIIHNSWVVSFCCAPLAAGQIITRLKLNMFGRPTTTIGESTGAFRKVLYLLILYWAIRGILYLYLFAVEFEREIEFEMEYTDPEYYYNNNNKDMWYRPNRSILVFIATIYDLMHYVYIIFGAILIYNVRSYVRSKYAIPETCNCPVNGCEDAFMGLVCPCLSVAQMLRHTTDYDTYRSCMFTDTGLPDQFSSTAVLV